MKINSVPPSLVQQVITDIKSLVPVHSVYWITGTRRHSSSLYLFHAEEVPRRSECYHLTLLFITYDKVQDHRALSDEIFDKSGGKVRTHLILYTYEEVYDLLDYGDNFLSRALRPENCLFQESS